MTEQQGPADSIRNAAALWVSSGKTLGFAEGVRHAQAELGAALIHLLEAKRLSKSAVQREMASLSVALATVADQRESEGRVYDKAAIAMVNRLEQSTRAGPTLTERLTAALHALRSG